MENDRIAKSDAQKNLAVTWVVATAVLILLFFIQTLVGNKYPGQSDEAWDWLIPQVFPTLTLMFGVMVARAQSAKRRDIVVRRSYYRLTLAVVIFYFIILFGVVFTAPLDFTFNETPALEHLKRSTKIVSVVQGCATITLSIFFVSEAPAR
ncbi:hypothetical protein [Larkinella humicola]|uniref:Uncharacterized protein n=1 Tax=Larkinella humicola TaxID=2607654 RepID=A0A5N1J7Q5_9BACT|nr:hypothetical protein [Larkinella humicola]KAA9345375.1 hypothetical protein F0P93_29370 [Larkinella humicola]